MTEFLSEQIITYIGNKRKILPFIEDSLNKIGLKNYHFLDLFSGSGVVSRLAKHHGASRITSNDLEKYSCVLNTCFLRNEGGDALEYEKLNDEWTNESAEIATDSLRNGDGSRIKGWIEEMYAPNDFEIVNYGERAFYTKTNAITLDTYLRHIFTDCPENLRNLFLASLIYEASVHVNTSGVFRGFYKNKQGVGQFGGEGKNALQRICGSIKPPFPVFCDNKTENIIVQKDASELISENIEYDIAYLDPPYNQHPYGSNYFMLNAIAENKIPENISKTSGIPKDWNRSVYNKREEGVQTLLKNIENINSKYILLSYSSEAFLSIKEMVAEIAKIGLITNLQEIDYNVYRASRNLSKRNKKLQEYIITIRK